MFGTSPGWFCTPQDRAPGEALSLCAQPLKETGEAGLALAQHPSASTSSWCSSAPKTTAVLLCHGSLPPHHSPTPNPLLGRWGGRGALRVSAGGAGGSCSCPGGVQGAGRACRVSQGNWGGLWPRLSCGPIDPFDRRRRASPALRDPDPPCGAAGGGGSSPSLTARTMPTHPPAHGPGATGRSHRGSGHIGDPVTGGGGPAVHAWCIMGGYL